jgi:hypothetical protein
MTCDVFALWLLQLQRALYAIHFLRCRWGSSLALAWKALSVLDRPAAIEPALLEALCPKVVFLDWFRFTAGIICGVLLFALVELVVGVLVH